MVLVHPWRSNIWPWYFLMKFRNTDAWNWWSALFILLYTWDHRLQFHKYKTRIELLLDTIKVCIIKKNNQFNVLWGVLIVLNIDICIGLCLIIITGSWKDIIIFSTIHVSCLDVTILFSVGNKMLLKLLVFYLGIFMKEPCKFCFFYFLYSVLSSFTLCKHHIHSIKDCLRSKLSVYLKRKTELCLFEYSF